MFTRRVGVVDDAGPRLQARLPLVTQPTLVTAGRSNTQHGHLAAIAARLPRAEVLETEGTYTAESAARTVAALSAWLDAEAK